MTLTCLKSLCRQGKITFEMIEWYGQTGEAIPAKLRGVRRALGANTVSVTLENAEGKASELRLHRASLVSIGKDTLVVYEAGTREPTATEQKLLDDWKEIQERYKKQYLYSDTYWQKKAFFERAGHAYLTGFEKQRGMRYELSIGKIIDENIKGDAILKYRIAIDTE